VKISIGIRIRNKIGSYIEVAYQRNESLLKTFRFSAENVRNYLKRKEDMLRSEKLYERAHQYVRRRRGSYEKENMNQLVCDDLNFFESLAHNGFMENVETVILDKWWILKDEALFIRKGVCKKIISNDTVYVYDENDPRDEDLNKILMTKEQFTCKMLVDASSRSAGRINLINETRMMFEDVIRKVGESGRGKIKSYIMKAWQRNEMLLSLFKMLLIKSVDKLMKKLS
jgi:hypothetical protein